MTASAEKIIEKVRKSEDAGERRAALIELGYENEGNVYPVLVEQLNHPNSSVQHAAVISLGRYGNPDAIEELVKPKNLHSPVVNVRWASVAALGKLGDFRIIDHLLKAVDDSEWIVRNQAVTELKDKIREIINSRDCKYARHLVRLLALEHEEIVTLVTEGFVELGSKCVPFLLDALNSPSTPIRKNAARALGLVGDKRAAIPLVDLLQDEEWSVRQSAAGALGIILDKRAVEPLVQALRDNVERVQLAARESLAGFGKLATMPLLHMLTYEKNKYSLRSTLLALGEIGDIKAVPALIEKLSSSYFVVRRAAQRALAKFGPKITNDLIPTLSYNQSDIRTLLKDAKDHTAPALQLRAVKALGGLEEHRAVGVLKGLVETGTPEVQDSAVRALIQIGCSAWGRCGALIVLSEIADGAITPHLVESLSDDSNNVRLEAVRALARVDGPGAVEPLIQAAKKDRDPYIRFEAVRHLRNIGVGHAQVLDLALGALKDPFRDVRAQAARLLGNFYDERSIKPLLKAMSDEHWSVRESAEYGLLNFGKKAVPYLIQALQSKSWTTRFRAARLLGDIGDRRAAAPLESLLKKKGERKQVKEVIQKALERLRGSKAA